MTDLTLHFEPESCALVPLIALEAIGHSYRLEVEIPTGQLPRSAEAIVLQGCRTNPTLEVDGEAFSGNVAVLNWLTERFPMARLLPRSSDIMVNARLLTDLAFCASTLEPLAARVSSLASFDSHDGARRALEEARSALRPHLGQMDARFAKNRWWYGDEWSIVDAYLHWVWVRVAAHELAGSSHTHLVRHDAAMKQRPAVRRALAINRQIAQCLAHPQLSARTG
jgi:glutathione S-transferase